MKSMPIILNQTLRPEVGGNRNGGFLGEVNGKTDD